jgi:hypothetical protein
MAVASVQVSNIPASIGQEDFARLFMRLDGCLGCRVVRTSNSE